MKASSTPCSRTATRIEPQSAAAEQSLAALKAAGNGAFKARDYEAAVAAYSKAIDAAD